jgi:hypothetical protein
MLSPLSPLQRQAVSTSSPIARTLDLGGRLAVAESLRWAGRIATAHVRLVSLPTEGDTIAVTLGAGARRGAPSPPGSVLCEFDADGSVQAGAVPVLLGPTPDATALALARALTVQLGRVLTAAVHPLDTAVIDVAARTPGASLALTTTAPAARVVVQNNGNDMDDQPRVLWMLTRTVSDEDIVRGLVRMDTGLRSLSALLVTTYAGANDTTSKPYNGTSTLTGGVLEATIGTAAGALVAGNILQLVILGTP